MNRRDNDTYVGDTFIVRFPRVDFEESRRFNGLEGKLLGFKNRVEYALPHIPHLQHLEPGIYQRIGDPIVRLETGKLIQVPIHFLEPQGYDYEDPIPKNYSYFHEQAKFKWVGSLPYIKCNVGDTILIAKHGRLRDDVVAKVDDVAINGRGVVIGIEHEDDFLIVPESSIIDVLELGEYSEEYRYRRQMQTVKRMLRVSNPGMKYTDHESEEKEEQ